MIVIRNVFRCKPGKAKDLVKMFKETIPRAQKGGGMGNARVMTDLSAPFWTVVFETEAESMGEFEKQFAAMEKDPNQPRKPMEGYLDLVESGYREIFRIE